MKKDIHPDYVETQVTCTCGATFTTRSTARTASSTPTSARSATRSTPASRRSSTPAAASPGSRPATPRRRPTRSSRRAERRPRSAAETGARGRGSAPAIRSHRSTGGVRDVRGRRRPGRRARRARAASSARPRPTPTPRLAKRLNQRYAELSGDRRAPSASGTQLGDDLEAARELAAEDPTFADEADEPWPTRRHAAEERLRRLLVPRDPTDDKDAILEVKSGEGGEESALFAGDLLRMYTRYAERRGWKVEVLDATESDLGGYKSRHRRGEGQGHARSPARRRTRC